MNKVGYVVQFSTYNNNEETWIDHGIVVSDPDKAQKDLENFKKIYKSSNWRLVRRVTTNEPIG